MAEGDDVQAIFKKHQVVPDVINGAPKQFLKVSYGSVVADKGEELTPTQVKNQPSVEWDAENNTFYTIILTDPDAPSRTKPTNREYVHWITVNIPGKDVSKGEVITAYVGAGPPEGTGLHRYVFLLYKQTRKMICKEPKTPKNSGANRARFSAVKFAKKYDLGDPIAGNFFQAKYDDYVPTVHKQLSGR